MSVRGAVTRRRGAGGVGGAEGARANGPRVTRSLKMITHAACVLQSDVPRVFCDLLSQPSLEFSPLLLLCCEGSAFVLKTRP